MNKIHRTSTHPQTKPENQPFEDARDAPEESCPLCERLFQKLEPQVEYHAEIDAALAEWEDDPHQRKIEAFMLACRLGDQGRDRIALEIFRQLADHDDANFQDDLNLARALEEASEPELALEAVNCVLKHAPFVTDAAELGLRILRQLGRSWRDHPWSVVPKVAELDDSLLERLIEYLGEAGAFSFFEVRFELLEGWAFDFSEQELDEFLSRDARFENVGEPRYAVWMLAENDE